MKTNRRNNLFWNVASTSMLLLIVASTGGLDAALKPKKPGVSIPGVQASGPGMDIDVENPKSSIYAEGHNVEISNAGNGKTKIWVDYDDNHSQDPDTEVYEGDASDIYIYGGAEDKDVDNTNHSGVTTGDKTTVITMTGGKIAGIYAGGYDRGSRSWDKSNVRTAKLYGNVKITVSGGSIESVSTTGEGRGWSYDESVTGEVSVLLYNCQYTGYRGITGYTDTNTTVRDFSNHVNKSGWSSNNPPFANYICQNGEKSLVIKGTVTVPDYINMTVDKINVAEGSHVECNGYIRLSRCGGEGISDQGTWTNHQLVRDHELSAEVMSKDANGHMLRCSKCGETVAQQHRWTYLESTDASATDAKHTKICAVCSYSEEEACTITYSSRGDEGHANVCKVCKHDFGTVAHTPKDGTRSQFNESSHKAVCGACGGTYKQQHDWNNNNTTGCKTADDNKHYACRSCGYSNETGFAHVYENGKCTICGYQHQVHTYDESSVCTVCHQGCSHTHKTGTKVYDVQMHYDECNVCHSWVNGEVHTFSTQSDGSAKCAKCGKTCDHDSKAENNFACQDCGLIFDCEIVKADGAKVYTETLAEAFRYVMSYKPNNATIAFLHDINLTSGIYTELDNIALTLDPKGFNLELKLDAGFHSYAISVEGSGTLNVINSEYTSRGSSYFTSTSWYPVLFAHNRITINISGCYLQSLNVGTVGTAYNFTGPTQVGSLTMQKKGGTFAVAAAGSLTIRRSLSSLASPIGACLPKGLVVFEEQDDETQRLFLDHTNTVAYAAGPIHNNGELHLKTCEDHLLTNAAPDPSIPDNHKGECARCGSTVSEAHSWTEVGLASDYVYHNMKCAQCGYQGATTESHTQRHNFDATSGKCTGCEWPAKVAVKLQGAEDEVLYGDIADAWSQINRPGYVDTLILRCDEEFSTPLTIATETRYYDAQGNEVASGTTDATSASCVPYIYIKGENNSLIYTGSGNAFVYPSDYAERDLITLGEGVKASENLSDLTISDFGCIKSAVANGKFSVVACNHKVGQAEAGASTLSYTANKVVEGETTSYLPTHRATCSQCRTYFDEDHTYVQSGQSLVCQHCEAPTVPVATLSGVTGEQQTVYNNLREAWDAAIEYSAAHDSAEVTITLNQDVTLSESLRLENAAAKIRLVGGAHKLIGDSQLSGNSMIVVNDGQLTIESGFYQACRYALIQGENSGTVRLEGGTFPKGHWNFDGIVASGHTGYGTYVTRGIKSMIAPGHYIKEIDNGTIITIESDPVTFSKISGTVVKCQHPSGHLTACTAKAATCTADGMKEGYSKCDSCLSYIKFDENNVVTEITDYAGASIPALGHDYNDGVCQRTGCGNIAKAVSLSVINDNDNTYVTDWISGIVDNEKGYDNFPDAWNVACNYSSMYGHSNESDNWTYMYSEGYTFVLKLYTDIDLSEYQYVLEQFKSYDKLIIDLNGHNLDLRKQEMYFGGNGYGTGDFIIKDSQKAGKSCYWNFDFYGSTSAMQKHLVLEDVHLYVNKSLKDVRRLELKGTAALTLDGKISSTISELSMTPDTYIESNGTSKIGLWGDYDPDGTMAKLMHKVVFANDLTKTGYTTIENDKKLLFYLSDGTECTQWKATMTEDAVTHNSGVLKDNGLTHGRLCSLCGFTTREQHEYVNHACRICGREAEAYVTIDGITTNYTYLFDIMQPNPDGYGEPIVYQAGALSAAKGKTATIKLNKDCQPESVGTDLYQSRSHSIIADDGQNTVITLNLNDHVLNGRIEVGATYADGGELVITDGPKGQGHMYYESNGECLYKRYNNKLTIRGGSFGDFTNTSSPYNRVLAELSSREEGQSYTDICFEGGRFAKLSLVGNIENGEDIQYCLGSNSQFHSMAEPYQVVSEAADGGESWYSNNYLLTNVMVTSNAIDLKYYASTLKINNATLPAAAPRRMAALSAEDTTPAVNPFANADDAVSNMSCRTFSNTGIPEAVDLTSREVLDDLQSAVSAAGYVAMITSENDINSYIEATLTEMTIETSGEDDVTTRMTFDVKPYATIDMGDQTVRCAIDNTQIEGEITFRLPVDVKYNAQALAVFHTAADGTRTKMGDYDVRSRTELGNLYKYVEVSTTSFSTFDYEIISQFQLEDAVAFNNENAVTLQEITYRRNFATTNVWEPLYVPVELAYSDFNEVCDIASIYTFGIMADTDGDGAITADDETILIVDPLTMGNTTANNPYVIRPKSTGDKVFSAVGNKIYAADSFAGSCSTARTKYNFHGIYNAKTVESALTLVLEEGLVSEAELGATVAPQRWYIEAVSKEGGYNTNVEIQQAQSKGIRVLAIGEDLTYETALRILRGETVDVWQDGQRFTLDGRRAVAAERSFQIVNGKKIIVKD